jgi:DNA-binding PadR family transcriptional regulator
MDMPPLSDLQMLVIEALGSRRLSGRELREALRQLGAGKSSPAFYQLMSRLEEAKFVEGEYVQKVVDDVAIRERFYRLTGHGARAFHETQQFYASRSLGGLTA